MPAIAEKVNSSQAQFYWHLGDFRAIYDFDQDMKERPSALGLTIIGYETNAWDDFIANQVSPFRVPVFLGIGNHETIPPKTRADYPAQFADWLNAPAIKDQRLRDDQLLSTPDWDRGDAPLDEPTIWAFMPLADGWAQLPVPNLTERIYLEAKADRQSAEPARQRSTPKQSSEGGGKPV